MNIHIIGAGWVGLVTAATLASVGHVVTLFDRDPKRMALLRTGSLPFYEPDLTELFTRGVAEQRIVYGSVEHALERPDVVFCCVGTPQGEDGHADVRDVFSSAEFYAQTFPGVVFVVKSTVPPGTGERLRQQFPPLSFASNPEFLAEGTAVRDALFPTRIVCGVHDSFAGEALSQVYASWIGAEVPFILTNVLTAELAKYAANAFLATKISFVNEMSELAERIGADMQVVAQSMGHDPRIGNRFLAHGIGYGGSCFPKDTQAILAVARDVGGDLPLVREAEARNMRQRERYAQKVVDAFIQFGQKGHVAFLGMAYKAGTSDVRSSPAAAIFSTLVQQDIPVKWYDPQVSLYNGYAREETCEAACLHASVVFVATDWPEIVAYAAKLPSEVVIWGRSRDTL